MSLAAIERRHQHRQETLAALAKIDKQKLSPADQLNYQLFQKDIAEEVEGFQYRWFLVPLDQRGGIQTENELADSLPFRTVKDYEDWIARLQVVSDIHAADDGPDAGRNSRADCSAEDRHAAAAEQIKKQIVEIRPKACIYKPFKNFPARYRRRPRAAEKRSPGGHSRARRSGLSAVRRILREEYYPACYDEVGAWQAAARARTVCLSARQFTTTSKTPDEIHAIGLAEVARIRGEMEKIVKQVKFEGSFQQFLDAPANGQKVLLRHAEELLNGYLALCKRIDPRADEAVPHAAANSLRHRADAAANRARHDDGLLPPALSRRLSPGHISSSISIGPRRGPSTKWRLSRCTNRSPAIICSLPCRPSSASCRRFAAMAASPRSSKAGGYIPRASAMNWAATKIPTPSSASSPTRCGGRFASSSIRACTHKKWTRQQAIDLFKENTAKTELDIVNEVDRYIAWPGQALAYKIGELKIKELRSAPRKNSATNSTSASSTTWCCGKGPCRSTCWKGSSIAWLAQTCHNSTMST